MNGLASIWQMLEPIRPLLYATIGGAIVAFFNSKFQRNIEHFKTRMEKAEKLLTTAMNAFEECCETSRRIISPNELQRSVQISIL